MAWFWRHLSVVGPVALGLVVKLHIMVGSDGAQTAHLMASEKKNSEEGTDTHMPLSGTATSNLRPPPGPTSKNSSTFQWYCGPGDPSQLELQLLLCALGMADCRSVLPQFLNL